MGLDRETLPWESVRAVGPDAVMVEDDGVTAPPDAVDTGSAHATTDLTLMSEDGDRLGEVVDAVLSTGNPTQVVGFEIVASEAMPSAGTKLLIPIDAVTATSAEAMVVPHAALKFVHDDLSGFGAAVEQFRADLEGNDNATQ